MSAAAARAVSIGLAIVLGFTLVHYVRREHLRRAVAVVTVEGGSRDRALAGKARRRARRAHRCTPTQKEPA